VPTPHDPAVFLKPGDLATDNWTYHAHTIHAVTTGLAITPCGKALTAELGPAGTRHATPDDPTCPWCAQHGTANGTAS
jgi:hypothetical protein